MHSVYSIPSHSASFRTGVEARSRDRECQPGELEPGNLYTVDLRNETQSKISRSRMQKKGTDSSGQNCITILPRSCQNPSFARATPSPIFGNHLGGSVPMPCRPHCRHPPDGSVLADVPSHSVRSGFHHLSSPLGKDSPIDDGNLQEIMGIFLTNTGCWTQGRGPGAGKAQTIAFIDAPAPSLNLIRHAGSPTITPTQSLGSRRTASRSRIVSSHPPSRLTTAGFVSVGQAIFAQAGQAAQARLSSMNTRLCRSLDWLKMARRPHGKPNLIDDLTPSPPAWPKRAKQTRHAQPLALHPVPTSRVHRSNCGVHRHSPIDLPLTGLLVEPGPSDGGCMQGME